MIQFLIDKKFIYHLIEVKENIIYISLLELKKKRNY